MGGQGYQGSPDRDLQISALGLLAEICREVKLKKGVWELQLPRGEKHVFACNHNASAKVETKNHYSKEKRYLKKILTRVKTPWGHVGRGLYGGGVVY